MKCQTIFSGKNKIILSIILSAEFAQRVLKVNSMYLNQYPESETKYQKAYLTPDMSLIFV